MENLFTEFTKTDPQQWKEQLVKDLKVTDYNSLIWTTNFGIDIEPFYTKANLKEQPSSNKITTQDWTICEIITVTDAKIANQQALNALQNGASGLVFCISNSVNYNALLQDILLEHIYCLFKIDSKIESELKKVLSKINTGSHCFVECDTLLFKNASIKNITNTICINTNLYHEAGSNTVNELSFSLAHLNEYLNSARENNVLSTIQKIHISSCIGSDFFTEISKLKSLRNLIELLCYEYSITPTIHIHAQTTLINKSKIDSYNNMLRSTTEAMSAAIAGADSILVLPFDYDFNTTNDFSLRMARNQQLILKEESYLNTVTDISAGSYYIETVTEKICQKAWEAFKIIEAKEGLINCLDSGFIQSLIQDDVSQLKTQFKEGKLVLVGINKFQPKTSDNNSLKKYFDSVIDNVYGIEHQKMDSWG